MTSSPGVATERHLVLTQDGIEDFLCEGNCKNPGMCDGTNTTWCGRKAEAILKEIPSPDSKLEAYRKALESSHALLQKLWERIGSDSAARASIDEQLKINVAALRDSEALAAGG